MTVRSFQFIVSIAIALALMSVVSPAAWATPVMNRSSQPAKYVADYDYGSNVLTILIWDDTCGGITPLHAAQLSIDGFKAYLSPDAYLGLAYARTVMVNDIVYVQGMLNDTPAIAVLDCNNQEQGVIYVTLEDIFERIDDTELRVDYERKGALMLSQSRVYPNPGQETPDNSSPVLNLYIAYADKWIQCLYDAGTGEVLSATTVSIPKEPKGTIVFIPDPSLDNMVWQDKKSGRVYMYSDSSTICNLNPGRVFSIQDTYVLDDYIVLISRSTIVLYSKLSKQSTMITSNEPEPHRPYVLSLEDGALQLIWLPYDWHYPGAIAYTDEYELPTT